MWASGRRMIIGLIIDGEQIKLAATRGKRAIKPARKHFLSRKVPPITQTLSVCLPNPWPSLKMLNLLK